MKKFIKGLIAAAGFYLLYQMFIGYNPVPIGGIFIGCIIIEKIIEMCKE